MARNDIIPALGALTLADVDIKACAAFLHGLVKDPHMPDMSDLKLKPVSPDKLSRPAWTRTRVAEQGPDLKAGEGTASLVTSEVFLAHPSRDRSSPIAHLAAAA